MQILTFASYGKKKISRTPDVQYKYWNCKRYTSVTVTESTNKMDTVKKGTKFQLLSLKLCFILYKKQKQKQKHWLVPGGSVPLRNPR